MAKKGQITIFIIIGLLLLVGIGIYLYVTSQAAIAPLEAQEAVVSKIPTEMQPLRNYVQDCLKITAKEALKKLGERGGYIEPRQGYNPIEPTEGRAVQFAPDSELKIPYWWHLSSKNNCVGNCEFSSERPSLENIKTQMDRYIKDKLPNCLGEFANFKEQQYNIVPTGEIEPDTQMTSATVIVMLTYPLEITRGEERFEIKDYVTELPVSFYEIYSLATNITNIEAQYSFLEQMTRTLIDTFSRLSENALPPVSDMEFGFGRGKMWTKFDVERKISEILTSYVPLLKVTYTKNYRYLPAPNGKDKKFYEVLYNRGFTVPVLEQHKSLEARFVYLPWWKPYTDLNCNGQICQAEGISNTWGFLFGVRRYNFAYDVSYPVLVEIKQPGAFGGEGYSFRYFLEANMRNNMPLAALEPTLTVPSIMEQSTLLCTPQQRTSGNITVNVTTSAGAPVDGAEILYRCGKEVCDMGATVQGQLLTKFPRCLGGFVTATHRDYSNAIQQMDITDESDQSTSLVMGVGYPVDFSVKKWMLRRYGINWEMDTTQVWNQGKYENTIIMLEKKKVNEWEEPVNVLGTVCGAPSQKAKIPCGDPPSDESKNVTLFAGDYTVTIYSFLYPQPKNLTIPKQRRCYKTNDHRKCYWVPTQPIQFGKDKPLISGYAQYDWTITEEQLKNTRNIEFTYINFALDKLLPESHRVVEDLEQISTMFSVSEQYEDILKPVLT